MARLLRLLPLLLLVQAATCAKELNCRGCVLVSNILERELYRPDQANGEPELGGQGPGRRMRHKLAEGEIFAALEGVCTKFARGHADAAEACNTLVDPLKEKLEEYIFDNGVLHLRQQLCIDLTQLCTPHQLYDSGEL